MTNIDVVSKELNAEIYYYRNFRGRTIKTRVMETKYLLDTDYLIVPLHSYKFLTNTSRFKDRVFVIRVDYDVLDNDKTSLEDLKIEKTEPVLDTSKYVSPSKNRIKIKQIDEETENDEDVATTSDATNETSNNIYVDELGRQIKKKYKEFYFKVVSNDEFVAYEDLQNEKEKIAKAIKNKNIDN